MQEFLEQAEKIMTFIANISIYLLEIIGIVVIIVGAIRVIVLMYLNEKNKKNHSAKHYNIKINLANALALGLEFKMGAEIIKTVIIREVSELLILGAIIILRALLAILIHWEIKVASKDEKAKQDLENRKASSKEVINVKKEIDNKKDEPKKIENKDDEPKKIEDKEDEKNKA